MKYGYPNYPFVSRYTCPNPACGPKYKTGHMWLVPSKSLKVWKYVCHRCGATLHIPIPPPSKEEKK